MKKTNYEWLLYILAGALQFSLLGYTFISGVILLLEPNLKALLIFLLSILPVFVAVIVITKKLSVKKSFFVLAAMCIIAAIVMVDYFPSIEGKVDDLYAEKPVANAHVCYTRTLYSLFTVHGSGGPTVTSGCLDTDVEGKYSIPATITLDPYSVRGAEHLQIEATSYKTINSHRQPSSWWKTITDYYALQPANYSLPDCFTIKNESVRKSCLSERAHSYAHEAKDDSVCQYAEDPSACDAYFKELRNYDESEGMYGVCLGPRTSSISAIWDDAQPQAVSFGTEYCVPGYCRYDYIGCLLFNTTAPAFSITLKIVPGDLNVENCPVTKVYVNGTLYNICGNYSPIRWGTTVAFAFNDKTIQNATVVEAYQCTDESCSPPRPSRPPPKPSDCDDVHGPTTKYFCYVEVAVALQDISICEKAKNDARDLCYLEFAKSTNNQTLCNSLVSESRREFCNNQFS